jgi:hypothetical protein
MNEKGELVYIPSSVTLYQFDENHESDHTAEWIMEVQKPIKRYKKTEKPMNVLVLGHVARGAYAEILYNSERWYVKAKDIFEIGEKSC